MQGQNVLKDLCMNLIINNSSMVPIYEQLIGQIKAAITAGSLKQDDVLPSVRQLAKELKISALTVKKAYDLLEEEGFVITVHGKGTYVAATSSDLLLEEQKKAIEAELEKVVQKARCCGISDSELTELFQLILED